MLPGELAVADMVWDVDSREIAVSRLWLQHVHHDTVTFSWGDALQTIADKVVSSLGDSSHGGQILANISGHYSLTRVDTYQIGTDGKATDKRTSVPSTAITGTGSGDVIPSLAAVVQLWGYDPNSYVQHAMRHRGRIFQPGTLPRLFTVTGELSDSAAHDIASRWGAFLNDIQGMHVGESAGIPGGPVDSMNVGVLSRKDSAFYQLHAVTCATKPGWQHRRMNKLAATRSAPVTVSFS